MKKPFLRVTALLLLFVLAFSFAACGGDEPPTEVSNYTYTPGDSTEESTTGADATPGFAVDTSWQANFAAEYKYFAKSSSEDTVTIKEARCAEAFAAVYPATGNLVYYKANGENVDCYTVVPAEKQYVHTVIKNESLTDLSSTYMKLTAVEAGLPDLTNVLYMTDETVAGRTCKKYIQRAYEDGRVTETVYVWVDAEYGFALRCEDYDADDVLQVYWETLSFTSGGVTEADLGVKLSDYKFTEGK